MMKNNETINIKNNETKIFYGIKIVLSPKEQYLVGLIQSEFMNFNLWIHLKRPRRERERETWSTRVHQT